MKIQTALFVALIGILALASCDKEKVGGTTDTKCNGVTCLNGGTCLDGKCACEVEYEGIDCGTLTRDKYLRTYEGMITIVDTTYGLCTVTITAGANPKEVIVTGLRLTNPTVETVPATTCIVMDPTTIWHEGGPYDIRCYFKGDSLTIRYSKLPTPGIVHSIYAVKK